VLKAAIQSYLSFSSYENMIILDNGSDYPPLLDYLKELELKGASVKYLSTAFTHAERAQLKNPIKAENDRRKAEYYVVTDPDIAFHDAPSDLLQTLIKIINQLDLEVVGPMLTINDIPKEYPVREYAWKRHVEQFWMYKPKKVMVDGKPIFFKFHGIDTTFGLHRAEDEWKRQKQKGARLYHPYEAKHLDWYFTPDNIPEDQVKYMNDTAKLKMTHWSSQYLIKIPKKEVPNWFRKIWVVQNGAAWQVSLPNSTNYSRQIIPFFEFLWRKVTYWIFH